MRLSPERRGARAEAITVRLAQEGADIIAVDTCAQIDSVRYAMATPGDLEQTVKEVEAEDRRGLARVRGWGEFGDCSLSRWMADGVKRATAIMSSHSMGYLLELTAVAAARRLSPSARRRLCA